VFGPACDRNTPKNWPGNRSWFACCRADDRAGKTDERPLLNCRGRTWLGACSTGSCGGGVGTPRGQIFGDDVHI
jgi:hypothetical protein